MADRAAISAYGRPFATLVTAEQTSVLTSLLAAEGGEGPIASLITVAYQGYYAGTREPAGWAMIGYSPVPEGVTPVDPDVPGGISVAGMAEQYDVIVVGAGAGGGAVAAQLSERGEHVLLIDRSRPARNSDLRGNHLQGKRTALYDVQVGPHAGNPRVLEHANGSVEELPGEGDAQAYGLNAMILGGGTRVWQGMSWRFWEADFRMASTYGSPINV